MLFNAIHEIKILAKISGFTVITLNMFWELKNKY